LGHQEAWSFLGYYGVRVMSDLLQHLIFDAPREGGPGAGFNRYPLDMFTKLDLTDAPFRCDAESRQAINLMPILWNKPVSLIGSCRPSSNGHHDQHLSYLRIYFLSLHLLYASTTPLDRLALQTGNRLSSQKSFTPYISQPPQLQPYACVETFCLPLPP
jgi:hypothetical protein